VSARSGILKFNISKEESVQIRFRLAAKEINSQLLLVAVIMWTQCISDVTVVDTHVLSLSAVSCVLLLFLIYNIY
jgi:hypothetical protein